MDTVQFWEERDYYPFSPSLHESSISEYLNGSHVPLKIIERKAEKVRGMPGAGQGICHVNCIVLAIGKQGSTMDSSSRWQKDRVEVIQG